MEYADIRRGSDVEFGQSIYEPFGIAQSGATVIGRAVLSFDVVRLRVCY